MPLGVRPEVLCETSSVFTAWHTPNVAGLNSQANMKRTKYILQGGYAFETIRKTKNMEINALAGNKSAQAI